jgi:hypothetical protein
MCKLAQRRFTSHSQGPGSVSSKSLMSKTRFLSGLAKNPKLLTCASPHAWTVMPVVGVVERSSAITAAAPRKNANGDSAIRSYRIGPSSGIRDAACDSRISSGWGADRSRDHEPCEDRGTCERRARPAARRSVTESPIRPCLSGQSHTPESCTFASAIAPVLVPQTIPPTLWRRPDLNSHNTEGIDGPGSFHLFVRRAATMAK